MKIDFVTAVLPRGEDSFLHDAFYLLFLALHARTAIHKRGDE